MGVLLFSSDPVALDATVCRLVGLRPEEIPTLVLGREMGLGTYYNQDIDIVGDDWAGLQQEDFQISHKSPVAQLHSVWLRNQIAARPVIDSRKCIKCGICVEMCPVKPAVVHWTDDSPHRAAPVYDYDRCIRCYCCQEMCPEGVIALQLPWLGRLLSPFHA